MNLIRVSIGCFILSVYFVFFVKSDQRTRNERFGVRRQPESEKSVEIKSEGVLKKHGPPTIDTKAILDSLISSNEFTRPVPRPAVQNSRTLRWFRQQVRNPEALVLTPSNQGEVYESLALSGNAITKLADSYIQFNLYTSRNPVQAQVLVIGSLESLRRSNFQKNNPTVFVTHGWLNSATIGSITLIRDAYLNGTHTEVNVIAVDWSAFGNSLYNWSSQRVETLGTQVARMINFLKSQYLLQLDNTTLVGHSVGAHVMGIAGRKVTGGKVNQIFGLDPARSSSLSAESQYCLSPESARHVQVIHTNGQSQGLLQPLGHADFYPNGGSSQPGCLALDFFTNGGCSHAQAFWLFAESLNSPVGFKAVRCRPAKNAIKGQCSGKVVLMGGRSNQINMAGSFYLQTAVTHPYALELRRRHLKNKNIQIIH